MKYIYLFIFLFTIQFEADSQNHSVAHEWSENLLEAVRRDFARPTVHARNLYHCSLAMYEIWALYDTTGVSEQLLAGQTLDGVFCPLEDFPRIGDLEAARAEAISFAMYRIMIHRFQGSPGQFQIYNLINGWMDDNGYDRNNQSTLYTTGIPATLGNYIAQCIIEYGNADFSNEENDYDNLYYNPSNAPLVMEFPGNPGIVDYNTWQPLTLDVFIDQSGNVIPFNTPAFLSPEWGKVFPFALDESDLNIYEKDGDEYWVYHDPGPPALIDTSNSSISEEYKWGFSLVSKWSSHLDKDNDVMWDISPASIGNIQSYPETIEGLRDFYDDVNGGDTSIGRTVNPKTGQPYEPQMVRRGDYGRILAEFWADGPDSETPPGHWFSILNEIKDHPEYDKRFSGVGQPLDELEYDVKAYLTLGGAMHDCAIAAWGVKGYYDYLRPVSAIRAMADLGQSSDPSLPNYHPGGFELDPGFIEQVENGDPLAGATGEHIGKIKVYAWRGPDYISNPSTDEAGVGWILAENWFPYQRPSFVTPPFAGYVSGHSTFSRAAAEVLTALTGDEYFPGGMGVFEAPMNDFLVFEEGPSMDIELQWATYRDASDQCSLSRIWGGIHPPVDDIPGRLIGIEIGMDAFRFAKDVFYNDADGDGFYSYEDCNDNDPMINPNSDEICDQIDNNCDNQIDENFPINTYYLDADGDGFGDVNGVLEVCDETPPQGYVIDNTDCNDNEALSNPSTAEVCDGIDNDCNGLIDDDLPIFVYYRDFDADGYGDPDFVIEVCDSAPPVNFVANGQDCNDNNPNINPGADEICDSIDNDCTGIADDGIPKNRYYRDADGDGFGDAAAIVDTCIVMPPDGYVINDFDCNDNDADINPDAMEVCDAIDNDCSGVADDGLPTTRYYRDFDGDGYGDQNMIADTCITQAPVGFVSNGLDCNDNDDTINPDGIEVCDAIDNDCNGLADDGLDKNRYYLDFDGDSFGDLANPVDTCISVPPVGYVVDHTDCDDSSAAINPSADEISDNGIDEDCTGVDYFQITKIFPVPVIDVATLHYDMEGPIRLMLNTTSGQIVKDEILNFVDNRAQIDLSDMAQGVYILRLYDDPSGTLVTDRVFKGR